MLRTEALTEIELSKHKGLNNSNFQNKRNVLKNYSIGPFHYFISKTKTENLLLYSSMTQNDENINFVLEKDNFIRQLDATDREMEKRGFFSLDQLLNKVRWYLNSNEFNSNFVINNNQNLISKSKKLNVEILLWSFVTDLRKLMPFLLDHFLEEIYVIPPYGKVIVDHQQFGRLNTEITFTFKEIMNFLHRVALENTIELSQLKPSIRGDLTVKDLFIIRVTGDIPPFALDGPSYNIRKLRTTPISMKNLVQNLTIDIQMAAFLIHIIRQGASITIVGSPGSGKTTLQTALLRELPKHWRVLSLEQAVEANVDLPLFLRYKQFNYISEKKNNYLSELVSQMLHRSPDYANLGEVTKAEEAIAWHHLLSAGVPVIQTIHALGQQSIIPRIIDVFRIPESMLASSIPHIFIEIKRFWKNNVKVRRIVSITELIIIKNKIQLQSISKFNPKKQNCEWLITPQESFSVNQLQNYTHYDPAIEINRIISDLH